MNAKRHIEACPLCGGARLVGLMSCTDHFASGEAFDVVECADCHFRMTQDAPMGEDMDRYYESPLYISHTNTRKGIVNGLYHGVRTLMLTKKAALIRRTTGLQKGILLDLGAGTGHFAHAMCRRGWEVTAVEKNGKARAYAEARFGLRMQSEDNVDALAASSFDAITLWHVMEHLEKLDATWRQMYSWLKDSGRLVVAVPNHQSFDAEHYGCQWAAYDVPRHLWHFCPQTMTRLAAKHRFELVEMMPMPFDAFYVSMLTEKNQRRAGFLRGLYVGGKAWLHAASDPARSSSVIYVFKKGTSGHGGN